MEDIRKIVEGYLKEGNWHIGDGVDNCSGWDEDGMEDEREELISTIREIIEDIRIEHIEEENRQ